MSTQPMAQCATCKRYRSPFSRENVNGLDGPFCAAFPEGIPADIYENRLDHRLPITGDHGLQWIPREQGVEFPERAFAPEAIGRTR